MKKIIVFLFICTILLLSKNNDKFIIPSDSIRFRILANSNTNLDQDIKWQINHDIIPIIDDILKESTTLDDARFKINTNMYNLEKVVNRYTDKYTINYGINYFPKKEYDGVVYPDGNYESLVITLGDGLGDNWWCVLFPPLCLLDAEDNNTGNIEYKSYVKEVIEKFE